MNRNERDLSRYIDRLNAEKKPEEHGCSRNFPEMEELFDTVRLVRGIKEPALPDSGYPEKLAQNVARRMKRQSRPENPSRIWFTEAAAVAAVVLVAVMLNFITLFNKAGIVYAMEHAFQGIKAYHGILEIAETNAEGKTSSQAKIEVWADKEGRYFVKELEGAREGLTTVNNGAKKWQLRPEEKQAHIFAAFPDPYRFTFELGKEVEGIKSALRSKIDGEEVAAGRKTVVMEVFPQGGTPYRLWVDKETKLPLKKQSGMQNALQYTVTYVKMDFTDAIPTELLTYNLPAGFEEISAKPEQIVANLIEAQGIAGFTPIVPEAVPAGYGNESISVETGTKTVKLSYASHDKTKNVVILESKSDNEFKPAPTAVLGRVGDSTAEIQSPVQEGSGILGGGPYAGVTGIISVRWQHGGLEYAVAGNVSQDEIAEFITNLKIGEVHIPDAGANQPVKPQVEVPVDLEAEENEQKSVDAGHSPWRLDPVFVAQVFVSLKISPEGISGEYPVKTEDLKMIQNTGSDAVVEVGGDNMPVSRVYLKRLIRQDATGIWTVVGYDR